MSTAEHNVRAAGTLIDTLARAGVRHVCMAPGSRSSPLVLAADRHRDISLHMILDERCAGYFALGLAKATRTPVVVGCTSGTAAPNLGPTLAEAAMGHVPLIVLTADRPPEQVDVGAAQTIRQSGLFSNHAAYSVDAPVPDESLAVEKTFATLGARLFSIASTQHAPVHANLPFREPLWDDRVDLLLAETRTTTASPRLAQALPMPGRGAVTALAAQFSQCTRGLIVSGPDDSGEIDAQLVADFAEKLGWPILADGLSPLRPLAGKSPVVIDTHEVLARCPSVRSRMRPDAVIRIGGVPTSKLLGTMLAEWSSDRRFSTATPVTQVALTARNDWLDPHNALTDILRGDPNESVRLLYDLLPTSTSPNWLDLWTQLSSRARAVLDEACSSQRFEGAVAHAVACTLKAGDHFVVGNSMPVRELDVFVSRLVPGVRTHANRGANGIDGVTSTALGIATASNARTVALIGDLSFLHDVGALQIANRSDVDLTIVVPNNDGGGIFTFLQKPEHGFEALFATPHGLDLEAIVRAHGIAYVHAAKIDDVANSLAQGGRGVRVIEIRTNREDNARIRTETLDAAAAAVEARAEAAA